jgi:hypothetical protein
MTEHPTTVNVLRNLKHGEQLVTGRATAKRPGSARAVEPLQEHEVAEVSTPFGYLFDDLAAGFPAHHLPGDPEAVTAALRTLGEAMAEPATAPGDQPGTGNSTIPPVYTYWGQFIDHDITANTDRQNTVTDITTDHVTPLEPSDIVRDLRNLRQPALNLDSVYGDGPTFEGAEKTAAADFYDGIALRLTDVVFANDDGSDLAGDPIVDAANAQHDLPRESGTAVARIGDGRNDENLIVAQLHVAFLRFHNAVLTSVREQSESSPDDRELFDRVSNLVRWHYQWLVVHDFLKTIALPGVVDKVLLGGNRFYAPRDGKVYMPLEFSVASYRFGHTMVRDAYDFNLNFGRFNGAPGKVIPTAPFGLLFAFTGSARPAPFNGGTTTLPANWVIDWNRFVDKGSSEPDHFARKIDTRIAAALFDMVNQVSPEDAGRSEAVQGILKRLAVRNLLRGYQLALPTGQAAARALGVTALTENQLTQGNSGAVNQALTDGGFLTGTPLWFYILKEAEVTANGTSLGEVGSRIVVETLIGQIRNDPNSYLHQNGWGPEHGVRLPNGEPIVTIKDLLEFAGVLTSSSAS